MSAHPGRRSLRPRAPGQRIGAALRVPVIGLGVLFAYPAATHAQVKASEAAAVEQTIDGTTVRIEYSRPSLRGRDVRSDLFGEQIEWGTAWTPGANEATTFETNKDVVLAGVPVPAGKYSVWMVVSEGPWELVLDPRDDLYHTAHPKPADDQIRAPIETSVAPFEAASLTWSFLGVELSAADIRMHWGDVAVDMTLEVEPSIRVALTPEEAAPYLGSWHVERVESEYVEAFSYDFDIEYTGGLLRGEMTFNPEFTMEVAFVEAAEQVFQAAFLINDEVAEVDAYAFMEFVLDDDGQAVSFEMRSNEDELISRGVRTR